MSSPEESAAPVAAPGGVDTLQFETAEVPDNRAKCTLCSTPIDDQYFHLSGEVVCPSCAAGVTAAQGRPSTPLVLRGVLYGAAAAAGCCIAYSLFTYFTEMEFGLIAILVGLAIGRAARTGSKGLGGRRIQVIAVALTYLSITTSYVPLIVKGVLDSEKQEAAQETKAAHKEAPPQQTAAAPEAGADPDNPFLAIAVLWGIALAAPFLNLAGGVSGLIGLAILFFGLSQAWRQTARDERLLTGPYSQSAADA